MNIPFLIPHQDIQMHSELHNIMTIQADGDGWCIFQPFGFIAGRKIRFNYQELEVANDV